MYKFLIPALCLTFSATTFAADSATVEFVHSKTKTAMTQECKKIMPGATDSVCNCVGEKAEKSLDDTALKNCPEGDGLQNCVRDAVLNAAKIALSDENIKSCGYTKQ